MKANADTPQQAVPDSIYPFISTFHPDPPCSVLKKADLYASYQRTPLPSAFLLCWSVGTPVRYWKMKSGYIFPGSFRGGLLQLAESLDESHVSISMPFPHSLLCL